MISEFSMMTSKFIAFALFISNHKRLFVYCEKSTSFELRFTDHRNYKVNFLTFLLNKIENSRGLDGLT